MADSAGPTQRHYRAPCPGCGAPVAFQSAQSTHAVCGYCQSTVVRDGEVLRRLGKMAELFDDHSLLQLGAAGRLDGRPFTLVGRLQYQYAGGTWTEWHALFDDGDTGCLSEDNGAYVFTRPVTATGAWPAADSFRVGATVSLQGRRWGVASAQSVALRAAEGELPRLPPLGQPFTVVELRSQGDGPAQVLSLDYGSEPPGASAGQAVTLEGLQMTGLKAESGKDEQGRQFSCPSCGAPVSVALAQSRSVTCGQCHSLIDLGEGVGGELRHAMQDEPVAPQIPLGRTGTLQGTAWQVVGFQHRMGHDPEDPDEHFGWSEYLLYHAQRGFAFLVDAEDGWSLVRPLTGAPALSDQGRRASYQGKTYTLQYSYEAETGYVAGEFYWQVQRGQKTFNRDYAAGKSLLSMEQGANEVTWSAGDKLDADTVARAFRLEDQQALLQRGDAAPTSGGSGISLRTVLILVVILVIVLLLLSRCTRCDPRVENCATSSTGTRSSGGSFGGFSGGGGHK